ncbi:MAG: N-acetyltransferase family protein [Rhodosalinus sp.]
MSVLSIRAGRVEDAAGLTELLNLPGVRNGSGRLPFTGEGFARDRVAPRPRFHSLVGMLGGRLIAWGTLSCGEGRRAHAGSPAVFVHDDHTGAGHGSAMMTALIGLADGWLGLRRLSVEVVADNTRAIELYQRFAFEREGVLRADILRDGVLVDCVVMGRLRDAPRRQQDEERGT